MKSTTISSNEKMHTEELVNILQSHGLLQSSQISNEKYREIHRKRTKKLFHNTELLLKKYRDLIWILNYYPKEIADELEIPFTNIKEFIKECDIEQTIGNSKLEGNLQSLAKTKSLIDRLNEAISAIKEKPEGGEKMYKIIYYTYICENMQNTQAICDNLAISESDYYRSRKKAIDLIGLRLWSTPNEADVWLDLVTLLGA